MMPVQLTTERLLIRPVEEGEVNLVYDQIHSDPDVMRFVPAGTADSLETSRARVARWSEYRARTGLGPCGVWERDGGFLGLAGVFHIALTEPELEVGYLFAKTAWGRGYATEAAKACMEAAFAELKPDQILALVMPGNDASIRVTEKLGMVPAGSAVHYEREMLVFGSRRT